MLILTHPKVKKGRAVGDNQLLAVVRDAPSFVAGGFVLKGSLVLKGVDVEYHSAARLPSKHDYFISPHSDPFPKPTVQGDENEAKQNTRRDRW